MGVSVGGGGRSAGRRRRGTRTGLMSEINVTPFVDVVLVLLIVFMVAAPMLTVGVPIDLPQTQAREMEMQRTPITVSVTPEGTIYVGDTAVGVEALVAAVAAEAESTADRIYVRGDATANYGMVMQVMGALSGAGYARIGLITEQGAPPPAGQ